MIEITGLYIYPVKSLSALALDSSRIDKHGLEQDRCWQVVDSQYNFVSQRQIPQLATIVQKISENRLILEHPDQNPVSTALDARGKPVRSQVHKDNCQAFDMGDELAEWLTRTASGWSKAQLRLVRFDPATKRNQSIFGDTRFADEAPLLITSEDNLQQLNQQLVADQAQPIPMDRFRPNLVVQGIDLYSTIGKTLVLSDNQGESFQLELIEPCGRCQVPTIDQQTGRCPDSQQPTRALHKLAGSITFGIYARISGCGRVSVGDRLQLL